MPLSYLIGNKSVKFCGAVLYVFLVEVRIYFKRVICTVLSSADNQNCI